MAFENLTDKISATFKKLRSKGRLTERDVKDAMREIKLALLEADVNFKVVRDFVAKVSERAVGTEVLEGLNPAQQLVKIVNEELTSLIGGESAKLNISPKPPTIVMFVGLQGAGKTTNIAKLASHLKKTASKRPLLVACDIYRPAAIKQLEVLGSQLDIPVFKAEGKTPVEIAKLAKAHAEAHGNDIVFLDTAGRLHIDEELMNELKSIKSEVSPTEIMLVIDAMSGQDAVSTASSFNEALGIDSIFMTKLDGDARGGAALSVRAVTGKPIKFVGTGEKLDGIEAFHPERMASRILGMGDVLSLIEKAEQAFDEKKAVELERKIRENTFTLSDFREQMQQMQNMGSMSDLIKMIPGIDSKTLAGAKIDERALVRLDAIISSMTPYERDNPSQINFSRKKRIAAGSGVTVEEVNKLLKQFEASRKMMKQMTSGAMGKQMSRKARRMGGSGSFPFSF
ncbi:MAG: signal recognition particle protein [Oscillospiraceae bacterium]|nr:signal recognition particle protein [Oscillospiraceae bacterium]